MCSGTETNSALAPSRRKSGQETPRIVRRSHRLTRPSRQYAQVPQETVESKVTRALYFQYLQHLIRLRWATLPESRLFRFCIVGGSGVVVDMGLLFLLSDPKMLGLGLTRSKLIAAETAIFTNFLLNDAWTFGDLARQSPGAKSKFRRFLGYNVICTAGVVLNVVLLNLLFNFAHMNRYLANAISIVAVTFWNYGLNRKLNWSPSKASLPPPPA